MKILSAIALVLAATGTSAANPLLMEYLARDPAVLTCAAIASDSAKIERIADIKLVKNFVTIYYFSDGHLKDTTCCFEKSASGYFEISYDEHLRASKNSDIGFLTDVYDLTRTVNRYKSVARSLPFYPIPSSDTMLGDVRR